MENTTFFLNPDYFIKNDMKRILIYSKSITSEYSSKSWFSVIHPIQAMVLSFFSKKRTLEESTNLISTFLGIDYNNAKAKLVPFIENVTPLKNRYRGIEFNFPKMLIIKSDNRCRDEFLPEDMLCETKDFVSKRLYVSPMQMTLMLTNKCVTNCCYCYADTSKIVEKPLSTYKILDLIKEARDMKLSNFNLIGGEVLLHKEWHIILKELINNGYNPDVISTKIPLTESILSKFEDANYTKNIQVSLDSISSDCIKRSLCVNNGYLDKMKKGVLLMDSRNFKYQIATILTKYNDNNESMTDMFKFLQTLKGIKSWRISPAFNSIYKNYQQFSKIRTNKERVQNLYSFIEKKIKPYANFDIMLDSSYINRGYFSSENGSLNFSGAKCSALNNHFFILPDGKVTICEQLYWNENFIIGDVNTNKLTEIWNSPQALRLAYMKKEYIDSRSRCNSCHQFQDCFDNRNRCWADIIKAYGDEHWDYPDPRCKLAPKMINNLKF